MILGSIENVIKWITLNQLQYWRLSTTPKNGQDNNVVFQSNPDIARELEFERMKEVVALCQNNTLYIFAKQKVDGSGTVGNFSEQWVNRPLTEPAKMASTEMQQPQQQVVMNGLAEEQVNKLISAALSEQKVAFEAERLAEERKKLEDERKEFATQQSSVLGTIVKAIAPKLQSVLNGIQPQQQQTRMAMGSTEGEVFANPIQIAEEVDEYNEEEQTNRLRNALAMWGEADPDFIDIVEVLARYANTGEKIEIMGGFSIDYNTLKNFIHGTN